MESRYNHLNEYYKNKFGERVLKICIDGDFTCPNRDGKCGYGGCIFCGESRFWRTFKFYRKYKKTSRKLL